MAKNKIWLIILLAVAIYLIMAIHANLGDLLQALRSFDLTIIPMLFLLTTIAYLIRFIKWSFFLDRADVKLGLKPYLLCAGKIFIV